MLEKNVTALWTQKQEGTTISMDFFKTYSIGKSKLVVLKNVPYIVEVYQWKIGKFLQNTSQKDVYETSEPIAKQG